MKRTTDTSAHSSAGRATPSRDGRRDEGSITVMMPILAVALIAMTGLVVDGGTALSARGRAADVAQQAARAGADALDPNALRHTRPARLSVNTAAATLAANRVLAVGGVQGTVTVSGDTVTVRASVQKHTAILSAVGVNTVQGAASATATILYGGTTEGH